MSKVEQSSSTERRLIAFPQCAGAKARASSGLTERGFTILELMIVVAIMMILIGIAAGMYQRSVHRAKEATLRSDLTVMRQPIGHYTPDKEASPQAPEDLLNHHTHCLVHISTDPITRTIDRHMVFMVTL